MELKLFCGHFARFGKLYMHLLFLCVTFQVTLYLNCFATSRKKALDQNGPYTLRFKKKAKGFFLKVFFKCEFLNDFPTKFQK